MKKSTKKTIASLIIILIFGMSTIAFVATGIFGAQNGQQKLLDKNVIDGPIDPNLEGFYIQNQYTFLKYYYREKDAIYDYVSQLPETMTLPTGEIQLFVERIESNESSATILNLKGSSDVANLTQQDIFNALCENLLFTPTDCLLQGIWQPEENLSQISETIAPIL